MARALDVTRLIIAHGSLSAFLINLSTACSAIFINSTSWAAVLGNPTCRSCLSRRPLFLSKEAGHIAGIDPIEAVRDIALNDARTASAPVASSGSWNRPITAISRIWQVSMPARQENPPDEVGLVLLEAHSKAKNTEHNNMTEESGWPHRHKFKTRWERARQIVQATFPSWKQSQKAQLLNVLSCKVPIMSKFFHDFVCDTSAKSKFRNLEG